MIMGSEVLNLCCIYVGIIKFWLIKYFRGRGRKEDVWGILL